MKPFQLIIFISLLSFSEAKSQNQALAAESYYRTLSGVYSGSDSSQFLYDSQARLIREIRLLYSRTNMSWDEYSKDSSVYNSNGSIAETYEARYDQSSMAWIWRSRKLQTYSVKNELILTLTENWDDSQKKWEPSFRTADTYDSHSRRNSRFSERWNANNSSWDPWSRSFTVWNSFLNPPSQGAVGAYDTLILQSYNSSTMQWETTDSLFQTFNSMGYLDRSTCICDEFGTLKRTIQMNYYGNNQAQIDSSRITKEDWIAGSWMLSGREKIYLSYDGPGHFDWDTTSHYYYDNGLMKWIGTSMRIMKSFTLPSGSLYYSELFYGDANGGFVKSSLRRAYTDPKGLATIDTNFNWSTSLQQYAHNTRTFYHHDAANRRIRNEQQKWDSNTSNWIMNSDRYYYYLYGVAIERGNKKSLKLYPNPAHHFITLDDIEEPGDLSWRIFDLNGKLALRGGNKGAVNGLQIEISSLAPGLYFLEASDNENTYQKQFIKK